MNTDRKMVSMMQSTITTIQGLAQVPLALRIVLAIGIMCILVVIAQRQRRVVAPDPVQLAAVQDDLDKMRQRALAGESLAADLAHMLHALPFPVWQGHRHEVPLWANAAWHRLTPDQQGDLGQALSGSQITLTDGNAERVYEIGDDGITGAGTAHYALAADRVAELRNNLNRFVRTLTQTFAHLPIGLAIFDRDRRLSVFNPALGDLLSLDPVWLAARPQFRSVMDRLRSAGRLPDRADFSDWLRAVQGMQFESEAGRFEETWTLPSGQILCVTGRPHPDGALAFVFEDISHLSRAESHHRAEIALNQAILDRLSEAVAVFDTAGTLVFANRAFDQMWSVDTATTLLAPDIHAMIQRWSQCGGTGADWKSLRMHVLAHDTRQTGQVWLQNAPKTSVTCHWTTLPDGAALVYFTYADATLAMEIPLRRA